MLHIFARTSNDVRYFTDDHARELDGLRQGPAGWWLKGAGEVTDPERVSRVFAGSSRARIVGYDLIFSAPRSSSVLLALDEMAAPHLVASHRLAVKAAVQYLEAHALGVRRKVQGEVEVTATSWREIIAFTHGVNRIGEPHLHDHVLVGATGLESDRAIDGRGLFAHLNAADALYRSELRHRLGEGTAYRPWRSFAGNELVVGVDDGYRALWSGRSEVRPPKKAWARDEIVAKWAADLEGFRPFGERPAPLSRVGHLDEHSLGAQLSGINSLFRRSAMAAWANAAIVGQPVDAVTSAIDLHLTNVTRGVGVQEREVSRSDLLQLAQVRGRGPRPLQAHELSRWMNAGPLIKSRIIEPGRELYPVGYLRSVEPERVALTSSRDISNR